MHTCTDIHTQTLTCIHTQTQTCINADIHIHIQYIHAHTHTHTHTQYLLMHILLNNVAYSTVERYIL